MTSGKKVLEILKSLVFAYVLTGIILVLLAFAVLKLDWGESVVNLVITATYVAAVFAGAFMAGKRIKEKKFFWGMLLGICYVAVIYVVAIFAGKGFQPFSVSGITTVVMCLLGGLLGGMLS